MPDYPDPLPNLTRLRRRHLETLRDVGHLEDDGSRAAHDCMVLMWTCHCYRDKDRADFISGEQARERYGNDVDLWWPKVDKAGAMLTASGRWQLENR